MPAAGWPAEDTPAESKAAPYANRARQTDPTAPQAPHSPEPRSPSMGGPVRPAPPAGYTKRAPPILVARRASQITPRVPTQRNHDQLLPSREFFSSLLEKFNTALSWPGLQRGTLKAIW